MHSIELVTFRLTAGAARAEFVENARRTEAVVRRQPGFVARMLTEGRDGLWSDIVTWTSHADAEAAAEKVMADPDFGPFGAMIDMPSLRTSHSALVWRMG